LDFVALDLILKIFPVWLIQEYLVSFFHAAFDLKVLLITKLIEWINHFDLDAFTVIPSAWVVIRIYSEVHSALYTGIHINRHTSASLDLFVQASI
jgi:hypothetical protein